MYVDLEKQTVHAQKGEREKKKEEKEKGGEDWECDNFISMEKPP